MRKMERLSVKLSELSKINVDFLLNWYEQQLLEFREELKEVNGLYALKFARDYLTVMQSTLGNFLLDDRLPEDYRMRVMDLLDLISSILSDVEGKLMSGNWKVEEFEFSGGYYAWKTSTSFSSCFKGAWWRSSSLRLSFC